MKLSSFLTLIATFFMVTFASAQVPQAVNYQAVIRTDSGTVVPNKSVNVRLSVQDGLTTPPQYMEVHTVTTNQFGLVTLSIGKGAPSTGVFSQIAWGIGEKFLKTEVDVNRTGTYTLIGTQQFLSVPYALYAEKAGNSSGGSGWLLSGNTATASSFIGTNNSQDLRFNTEGSQKMVVKINGNVGIGTTTPSHRLRVETNSDNGNDIDRIQMQLHNTSNSSSSFSGLGLSVGNSGTNTWLEHISSNYNVYSSAYSDFNDLTFLHSTGSNGMFLLSSANSFNAKIRFGIGLSNSMPVTYMSLTRTGLGLGTETPKAKIEVANGDVYISNSTKGIILTSPNGGCWRVTIDNSGNFVRTSIACPN